MCTPQTLDLLLKDTYSEFFRLFGDKLVSVVLYGSYARGDHDSESDIDVLNQYRSIRIS